MRNHLCAAAFALFAAACQPAQPLTLDAPLSMSAEVKLTRLEHDGLECQIALGTASGLRTRVAEPGAGTDQCPLDGTVVIERSGFVYGRELAATCPLAAALYLWEKDIVAPAAQEHLGGQVVRIEERGTFSCRNRYGRAQGDISEHARANAIDVAGMRLADGRHVSVQDDWGKDTPEGRFLAAVRDRSCRVFDGVLSPDYNAAHRDHLHLDRGPDRICS
ncbi:MAG: extensin family protein [Hyphomonadaceae bacterium]|nr:extensin family protein [Hyphomonadaceae bacterium]